ncbi:methionine aminotransferase [Halocola ammonii]
MPRFQNSLTSKLPQVGTTIFSHMSELAAKEGAINLSQGFPNFSPDEKLVKGVTHYMQNGYNQYAPLSGVEPLRKVLSEKLQKLYDRSYDFKDEVNITAGATQAIYTAISAFVKEEDEVIIFTPAYDCYAPAVTVNGGKPIYVQLKAPEYKIDWGEVEKVFNRKTKMIVINTPHNPTGTVIGKEDLQKLEKLVRDSETIILSDEVYEHIVFDNKKHFSPAISEELANRTLLVYSFGKTFHVTGWKMGFIAGPEELIAEFRKVHQYNVFCCNTPIQYALADYLSEPAHYEKLGEFYQLKRDAFLSGLKDSRFTYTPSAGTYFQLLNYSEITNTPDVEWVEKLTKQIKVAAIPVSVFYHQKLDEHMLRFCFAKDEDTLYEAGKRLSEL